MSKKAWQQRLMYAYVLNTDKDAAARFPKKSSRANESQKHESLGWGGRLLAFHWALASREVRGAVVHLQFPPWLREGVHCGWGGQWRAMVCLYMHLKVGCSGETWDQEKNKEQGNCCTHSRPWLWEGRPVNKDSQKEQHPSSVNPDWFGNVSNSD